jgi:hypothetical protein
MANNNSSEGIGFNLILFLVFLVLKLTGHIDWSWWWVTSPLWITFILVVLIIGILYIIEK